MDDSSEQCGYMDDPEEERCEMEARIVPIPSSEEQAFCSNLDDDVMEKPIENAIYFASARARQNEKAQAQCQSAVKMPLAADSAAAKSLSG
ncbi:hypothetical protein PRIPAC_74031 [Pristionchus pacificus]|uniref:Uncharacterized protein n=1 Tax=Pristionchus pacificus TaxID=54126 RepID=A0A2A6C6Z9_PRIPA|nr:hypothetical protein PRIPAC_74031 [Pristionchus pacificus]|eukprot:PDM73965.1 hypothetical protein PRIPAC_41321 [Pristionchus pacificus]